MSPEDHKRFVYLSVVWCQIREEFHTKGTSTQRKHEIRKRKEQIEAEQDQLLKDVNHEDSNPSQ